MTVEAECPLTGKNNSAVGHASVIYLLTLEREKDHCLFPTTVVAVHTAVTGGLRPLRLAPRSVHAVLLSMQFALLLVAWLQLLDLANQEGAKAPREWARSATLAESKTFR